jgi:hypothetical protein
MKMLTQGLVEPPQLRSASAQIEPELYRFPAVDPAAFRSSVEQLPET